MRANLNPDRPRHLSRGLSTTVLVAIAIVIAAIPISTIVSDEPQQPKQRPPAVADSFYPIDPGQLRASVQAMLEDAKPAHAERPVALVAPHAGYIYSGQIAADAWRQVADQTYDVVVILGPNHTVQPFEGAAPWDGDQFLTPLGPVEIDREAVAALRQADPSFVTHGTAHDREHSVEVQLPFVQVVFPNVKVVPVVVGGGSTAVLERLGRTLARVLKKRKPLIVASSDLSHYPAYEAAVECDQRILDAVVGLDVQAFRRAIAREMRRDVSGLSTCACGENPIIVTLAAAKELGATHGRIISYANSGDSVMADRSRVVGYGAVAFVANEERSEKPDPQADLPDDETAPDLPDSQEQELGRDERAELLRWARKNIERYMQTETAPLARELPAAWDRKQGVFVTLKKDGELRGCIGQMTADLPIGQAVGAMALQAGFNDRRFRPLQPEELQELEIEISLLSPLSPVSDLNEIVLGRDGVRLEKQDVAAVFLPKVPVERGWNRDETLRYLCQKAGLPEDCWRSDARLFTFQAEVFSERPSEPPT